MLAHTFPLLYSQGVAPVVVPLAGPCARVTVASLARVDVGIVSLPESLSFLDLSAVPVTIGPDLVDVEVTACPS